MRELTDAELMNQFKKGSEEAYVILYHRYVHDVYRFINLSISDTEHAEDLVQETFIRVYKNRRSFDPNKAGFRTWLHRIAYRLCIDHYRKQSRAVFTDWDSQQAEYSSVHVPGRSIEDRLLIEQYLRRLPSEDRAVLVLAYYQGLPGKQISAILGMPVGTVKSKLHYSLKKLKQWMEEVPIDETGTAGK